MKTIIQECAPQIREAIDVSSHVLLHCHPHADPDSVGSALAMKFALESLGKKVTVIQGDNAISHAFEFPGVKDIVPKSFGEIDLSAFDLFISQDSGSIDMISKKIPVVFPPHLKVIVIDHHKSNTGYGSINCIDSGYAATAMMLYDLFKEMNIVMTHDIALNLFMGIYTDTGGFRHENTTLRVFEIATELVKFAPEYYKTIFTMDNSHTEKSLVFEGVALSSFKKFHEGKLAMVAIPFSALQENNISEEDIATAYISNKLKSVVGFDIAVTLIENVPGVVKGSLRSRRLDIDLSLAALALGGGGHKGAAGFSLSMPLDDAIIKVAQIIKDVYNL